MLKSTGLGHDGLVVDPLDGPTAIFATLEPDQVDFSDTKFKSVFEWGKSSGFLDSAPHECTVRDGMLFFPAANSVGYSVLLPDGDTVWLLMYVAKDFCCVFDSLQDSSDNSEAFQAGLSAKLQAMHLFGSSASAPRKIEFFDNTTWTELRGSIISSDLSCDYDRFARYVAMWFHHELLRGLFDSEVHTSIGVVDHAWECEILSVLCSTLNGAVFKSLPNNPYAYEMTLPWDGERVLRRVASLLSSFLMAFMSVVETGVVAVTKDVAGFAASRVPMFSAVLKVMLCSFLSELYWSLSSFGFLTRRVLVMEEGDINAVLGFPTSSCLEVQSGAWGYSGSIADFGFSDIAQLMSHLKSTVGSLSPAPSTDSIVIPIKGSGKVS